MESKFETLKEIDEYALHNDLTDEERRALFERRMQIFFRIRDWREENKKLGLEPTISDDWTPQKRESFLRDWFDDASINTEASRSDETINPSDHVNEGASTSQAGRGEKRTHEGVGDDDEDERPYAIEGAKEVNIKKFRTKGTNYSLRFNNTMADVEIKDVHERLHDVFQHILNDTVGDVPSRDQVRMVIHSTQLKKPIAFPFKPAQPLTTKRIMNWQTRLAQELHTNANVPLGPCGIEEAKQFQAYLTEYQINIVSKEYGDNIIYNGPNKDKRIYLYMHNNHYDVITKMPGFFARAYYCHECKKAYSNWENHLCPNTCKCCGCRPICPELSWMPCNDCGRMFKSRQCYRSAQSPGAKLGPCVKTGSNAPNARKLFVGVMPHRKNMSAERKSAGSAANLSNSKITNVLFNPKRKKKKRDRSKEDESGGFFDTECREDNREDDDEPIEDSLTDLLFFDFECRQENGTHEPNLCIVQNEAGEEWIF